MTAMQMRDAKSLGGGARQRSPYALGGAVWRAVRGSGSATRAARRRSSRWRRRRSAGCARMRARLGGAR
jgi:hypothetical protein